MIKKALFFIVLFCMTWSMQAQSFAWGLKGGPTLGFQKWESQSRDLLFKYHGIAFIESLPAGNDFALFAQVGYHIKGSSIRNQRTLFGGGVLNIPTREFQFRNISLSVGAKQKFDFRDFAKSFYAIGIRGDYTVSTNLSDFNAINTGFFPSDAFVRKINYGVYIGGGLEFALSELIGAVVELSVSPDFSFQYQQPPLNNVTNPYTGNPLNIAERKIVNVVLELSVGIRFLRVVEYVD